MKNRKRLFFITALCSIVAAVIITSIHLSSISYSNYALPSQTIPKAMLFSARSFIIDSERDVEVILQSDRYFLIVCEEDPDPYHVIEGFRNVDDSGRVSYKDEFVITSACEWEVWVGVGSIKLDIVQNGSIIKYDYLIPIEDIVGIDIVVGMLILAVFVTVYYIFMTVDLRIKTYFSKK